MRVAKSSVWSSVGGKQSGGIGKTEREEGGVGEKGLSLLLVHFASIQSNSKVSPHRVPQKKSLHIHNRGSGFNNFLLQWVVGGCKI